MVSDRYMGSIIADNDARIFCGIGGISDTSTGIGTTLLTIAAQSSLKFTQKLFCHN